MENENIITEDEIKDGDFVINIDAVFMQPRKVERNINGTLGFKVTGYFSWIPIGKRHKKIIYK